MVRQHHRRNVRLIPLLAAFVLGPAGTLAQAAGPAGISQPLTDQPGNPKRGEAIAMDFNRGDCNGCHRLPVPGVQADDFGDLGPSLAGVGSRLTVPELRQRVVNAKAISPETIMPAYFLTAGLNRVAPKYAGKTILTAQEVEDVVAYLATLK